MPEETSESSYKFEIEVDPTKLTEQQIKQIGDRITAEIAQAAARSRDISGGGGTYTKYTAHWKSK